MNIDAKRKAPARVLLLAAAACTGHAGTVQDLDLRVIEGLFAVPANVRIARSDDSVEVSGQVLKRPADASRRLYDRIRLEVLDAGGRTLVERETRPRRVGLGRHSYRGRFDFTLDQLPEAAALVKVGYF